jgi:Family of unknown function (DUF5872)
MSPSLEKGVFQPNFVRFTNTDIVERDPIAGTIFQGNQNNGFRYVTFSDGSGGIEKRLKNWTGNKTGRFYRGEVLAANEYLAARVGEIMNAPIRDCLFTSTDAQTIVMPFIDGKSGKELCEESLPNNPQGIALHLFDYLTANSDRRPKNVIFASNGNIVGIDHALCNFRPRNPKPELVSELWNGGVTLDNLEALKPKLMPLQMVFQQFGMGEQFLNLIGNLDRLIKAFQQVEAVVVAKEAFEPQTPPKAVQEAAKRALEWMADGKAGRNFTSVGRKRASDLAHGHPISLETLKRMKAYFDRHGVDKQTPHWNEPSPGKVAWYAWGGDAGYSWAKQMVARAEKASEKVSKAFDTDQRDKIDAKIKEADSKADEAMNLRRNEKWESAYFAHKESARLYNAAASLIGGDDDGELTAVRGKAASQNHLADEAKFQGDTDERHSPAEMDDSNPPTSIVKADDYDDVISDRKGEPIDQDLYDKVKYEAQSKFDVYPSAVANGWVVQEYKRRGGKYRKPVKKGDILGHPFRGNQYSQGIVDSLDRGESPEIASHELPEVVSGIHDLGPREQGYDITNLTVDGEKPFQTTGDDQRLREHMPQILPSQRQEFLKDIQEKYGIKSRREEVDPQTLKPSQNEIDGYKTGGVFKEFGETGVPEKRAPLVSRDGYIIDGHHYWSASLVMRAQNPNYKLPIQRLDCDINTALHVANEWHDEVGNERLSIGKAGVAGASGDKPGHEFHGNQWDNVGPNGLPISQEGKSPTARITPADWKTLDSIFLERWKTNEWGNHEKDSEGQPIPGAGYSKRIPEKTLNAMLKTLNGSLDENQWVKDFFKSKGMREPKSWNSLSDKVSAQLDAHFDRCRNIVFAARLGGLTDKDWPQKMPPAYPLERGWITTSTPLTSRDEQLAREVLKRDLENRVPAARTTMSGLLAALQDKAFKSGLYTGKTGISFVSNQSRYFEGRRSAEGKLWGNVLAGPKDEYGYRDSIHPFIGYMAPKNELLDPSKPEDIKAQLIKVAPKQLCNPI